MCCSKTRAIFLCAVHPLCCSHQCLSFNMKKHTIKRPYRNQLTCTTHSLFMLNSTLKLLMLNVIKDYFHTYIKLCTCQIEDELSIFEMPHMNTVTIGMKFLKSIDGCGQIILDAVRLTSAYLSALHLLAEMFCLC